VEGSLEPGLQVAEYGVRPRQDLRSARAVAAEARPVLDALTRERGVTLPCIGEHRGFSGIDRTADERSQLLRRGTPHDGQADCARGDAAPLHGDRDARFAHPPSKVARLVASDVRLIRLDGAREPMRSPVQEPRAEFVEQRPSRLVAAQTRILLELQGGDPLPVSAQEEHGEQPDPQRHPRPVQDRPRGQRGLVATLAALLETPRLDEVAAAAATARAHEPSWPSLPAHKCPAARLVRKPFLELNQRLRKLHAVSLLREPASRAAMSDQVTG